MTPTRRALRAYTLARLAALPALALFAGTGDGDALSTSGHVALVLAGVWGLATAALSLSSRWERVPVAGLVAGDVTVVLAVLAASGGINSGVRELVPVLLLVAMLVFDPRTTLVFCVLVGAGFLVAVSPDLLEGERDAVGNTLRVEGAIAWVGLVAWLLARVRSDYEARLERASESRRQLLANVLELDAGRRRQFATDLHEGPLQLMLAARQDLEEAAGGDAAGHGRGEAAVVDAIAGLRDVIAQLHPVALDHGGLDVALRALAGEAGARAGFVAVVSVTEEARGVADDLVVDLGRMALENVALDRGVTGVRIDVGVDDGWLVFDVRDDGAGFSEDNAPDSLALATASERVAAIGGTLDVVPTAEGLTLTARLPVA